MDQKWIKSGSKVDQTWIKNGLAVNQHIKIVTISHRICTQVQTTASSQLIKLQMKNKSETQVRVVDNKRLKCKQLFRQVYKNIASGIKCQQLLLSSNAKHQSQTGIKLKDWV